MAAPPALCPSLQLNVVTAFQFRTGLVDNGDGQLLTPGFWPDSGGLAAQWRTW
jgi:hypothetical protein